VTTSHGDFEPRLNRRRAIGHVVATIFACAAAVGLLFLLVLIIRVTQQGASWVSLKFLNSFPSVLWPENAGIKSALFGTLWIISITAIISVVVGVAAAVWLEEFAEDNRLTRLIRVCIANLAGVPSVVYGILGLAVFVRYMNLGRSVLAGGLTLSLLILPVVIIASREAIAAVPRSFRLAAAALGATRWQTVRSHVLPSALPGIMTGVILALSRAIGEAAPLLMLGALTYVAFVPEGLTDEFTALPLQIYDWTDRPQPEFHHLAAAGIIVLLGILIPMNAVAVAVRAWHQRRKAW